MSAASSIGAMIDWRKDLPPPRKYNFLLDGKPYKGAFNRKYVGNQVTYYTGIKPTRFSQQLEYVKKGYTIEDEPVKTIIDKWIDNSRKIDPYIQEVPIYSNIIGHLGISDEEGKAVRAPIIGYQVVKKDPYTGEKNVLATYYDEKMKLLVAEKRKTSMIRALDEILPVTPEPQRRTPPPSAQPTPGSASGSTGAYSPFQPPRLGRPPNPPQPPSQYPQAPTGHKQGVLAKQFMTDNFDIIKNFTNTIKDRDVDNILSEINQVFKVGKKSVIKYYKENPNLIDMNLRV